MSKFDLIAGKQVTKVKPVSSAMSFQKFLGKLQRLSQSAQCSCILAHKSGYMVKTEWSYDSKSFTLVCFETPKGSSIRSSSLDIVHMSSEANEELERWEYNVFISLNDENKKPLTKVNPVKIVLHEFSKVPGSGEILVLQSRPYFS